MSITEEYYECVKCGSHFKADTKLLFTGCPNCKNKFFKIVREISPNKGKSERKVLQIDENERFLLIKEHRPGVYSINLQQLLAENNRDVAVVGREGIYKIELNPEIFLNITSKKDKK